MLDPRVARALATIGGEGSGSDQPPSPAVCLADPGRAGGTATPSGGLSDAEAGSRLRRDGPNRLPPPKHKTFAAALVSVALQPMVLLLFSCALLYALLGSVFDSIVLALSIVSVAAISIYQELRTQRVLEALRDLASPRSSVVRGGVVKRISSQELVEGDRLIVLEGDRLACDARLVEAHGLRVDESLLTGESVPVDKGVEPGDADACLLHAGTLVVQGDGVGEVIATGVRTTLGRIGGTLASIEPRPSRLHADLTRLVRTVAFVAVLTCVLAATVFAWRDGSWTTGLLVGLTLAMSIIPEEFAVVWAVMLALGAWRLAQEKVLTRQPQAIEALGATTVLCVDKTGTLTRNRMEVAGLHDGEEGAGHRPGEAAAERYDWLLRTATLASVRDGLEPMDQAIFRLSPATGRLGAARLEERSGVQPGRPFVRQVWRLDGEAPALVAIKGAFEAVLARCTGPAARLQALTAQGEAWASEGKRVIAVASVRCSDEAPPPESGWHAVGLIAFEDPLRDDVPAALQECHRAGVRVVMITGDAPATALAIALRAGLATSSNRAVLTGAQFDAMSDAQFELAVAGVAVFARVTPAQKLRIVQALQRRGEVVTMTGDGINDGPALRAADVGVAMGERGTDVAREAAGVVLLDDRFASLVLAVRAGRRIHANLQKAMGYLFAVHVPIVGLSLLPMLGGPVLLLPIHVVLLELIIDPACSLVFEAEPLAAAGMKVPPRRADAPLFSPAATVRALAIGGIGLIVLVAVQQLGHVLHYSDAALRLAGLATLVVGNLAMLQWFRSGPLHSRGGNQAFHVLLLGVCAMCALVLLVAPLNTAFGFPAAPDPLAVAACLAPPALWALARLAVRFRSGAQNDQVPAT
ncbi:MAG TPA: cation-translocating P-type ATPase [Caldimonas sp.]|nr:cation-translocating P-type ATPase [Caldimonas sp.]